MSLSPDARLLKALAGGEAVTQRSLSRELGVALGLTNLLIRRLVAKGYVRVAGLRPRHVRYLLTAEGQRALADMTCASLQNTVSLYTATRDSIRTGLERLVDAVQPTPGVPVPVVFYGLGDVAEIAFVSLQSTDLVLAGAIDDVREGRFFGHPIERPSKLCDADGPLGTARIIVTTVRRSDEIRARLEQLGVSQNRVLFLDAAISEVPRHNVR
jgi:DNA-binding MarR family transcriptional regulator